jgi:acetyl-CoA C-acetyltransferase
MKIGIIAVGYGDFFDASEKEKKTYYENSFISTKRALQEVGMSRSDVDIFIEASIDLFAGRLISNMYTCTAIGSYLKDETNTAEDSTLALIYAYMKLKSGLFDVAVVNSSVGLDVDYIYASTTIFDPFIYRPLSMNYLTSLAMQASSYKSNFRIDEEYAAKIVENNRSNASKNPRAFLKEKVSIDEVLKSEYIIWPLRELMLPKLISGSVSLIIATEDIAKRYNDSPIWIEDVAWCTDGYYLGTKKLSFLTPLYKAARKVYNTLGIENPAKEIDLFEISDVTPYHQMMSYEALKLTPIGKGYELIDKDPLSINLSGGNISTYLFQASGLFRIAEAFLQLSYKAGNNQIEKAEKALIHGFTPIAGASTQTHSVILLGV